MFSLGGFVLTMHYWKAGQSQTQTPWQGFPEGTLRRRLTRDARALHRRHSTTMTRATKAPTKWVQIGVEEVKLLQEVWRFLLVIVQNPPLNLILFHFNVTVP